MLLNFTILLLSVHSYPTQRTDMLCRYIMSTVSSLLSTFNAQHIRAQETQRQLDSFCRSHKLPTVLARKLSTYYDYVLPRTVHEEDLALVSGLSGALRQQVGHTIVSMRCCAPDLCINLLATSLLHMCCDVSFCEGPVKLAYAAVRWCRTWYAGYDC